MLLTQAQLLEIRQIILDYHNAFIANVVSPELIAPEILKRLKAKGLIDIQIKSIQDAYLYGQLLAHLENPAVATMTYEQFKQHLKRHPIPLTTVEKHAIQMAEARAGQFCAGLGNRVDTATGTVLINADSDLRNQLHTVIRDETSEAIARRESVGQLTSRLGWATQDFTRDWRRIANTEMQEAMQTGLAEKYKAKYGTDILVAKVPMPDACEHCKRLFLKNGVPRVFVLTDLQANGNNVGRKAADWLPTIGVVHPHCQCQLIRVPEGWGFNDEGDLVPGGKLEKSSLEDFLETLREEDDFHKALAQDDRIDFQGLPIRIENRAGTLRHWKSRTGEQGTTQMLCAYGEILGTNGTDEDPIDVFIGPEKDAQLAYIIEQQVPESGMADEQKVMLGFPSEDFALQVYRAHFDKPGHDVTVSPMPMDSFHRWMAATHPARDEMMSEEQPVLVVPISKAEADAHEIAIVAAASSPAGGRNPGPGTAPNFLFNVPRRTPPTTDTTVFDQLLEEEVKDKEQEEARERRRRDKHNYDITIPVPDHAFMLRPPVERAYENVRDGLAEERQDRIKEWELRNTGLLNEDHQFIVTNMHKAQTPAPAGPFIGPKGGKWADPEHTIHWEPGTGQAKQSAVEEPKAQAPSWVHDYAESLGGKVVPHKAKAGAVMVKVPHSNKQDLEDFAKQKGLAGKVISGTNYAMLEVGAHELGKLTPPQAVPKPKETTIGDVDPSIYIDPATIKRMGEFPVADVASLIKPTPFPGMLSRGHKVRVMLAGEKVQTELAGCDKNGKPCVMEGGKRRVVKGGWKDVKPVEAPVHKAVFERTKPGAVVQASPRHRQVIEKLRNLKVVGNHTLSEYLDWMDKRGQETYLVGGLVRDMLAESTHPQTTDEQILEKMNDVDLVGTAPPSLGWKMMEEVAPEVVTKYGDKGGIHSKRSTMQYGIVSAGPKAAGLDYNGMHASGMFGDQKHQADTGEFEVPTVWDHDIEADSQRRDFTCNALYYDPKNHTIIDPTGMGIADAQNKVLRIASGADYVDKNHELVLRYLKFRSRGYKTTPETTKKIHELAKKWFKAWANDPVDLKYFWTKYLTKGQSDAGKALGHLKKVMQSDGLMPLYDKYIAKHEAGFLKEAQSTIQKHGGAK